MGLIYLLMILNIPNLMLNWIYEFLSWEDHMQALCTTSEGQKYEEDTHKIDVRLMLSNIEMNRYLDLNC